MFCNSVNCVIPFHSKLHNKLKSLLEMSEIFWCSGSVLNHSDTRNLRMQTLEAISCNKPSTLVSISWHMILF